MEILSNALGNAIPNVTYQGIMELGQRVPPIAQSPEAGRTLTPNTEVLYRGLGQLALAPLTDEVVDEARAKHLELSKWTRDRMSIETGGSVSLLSRSILNLRNIPIMPEQNNRRFVHIKSDRLILGTCQIFADDLRDIITTEKYANTEIPTGQAAYAPEAYELANTFSYYWDMYSHNKGHKLSPEDKFSAVETAALGLMTHVATLEEMAAFVGIVSTSTMQRVLGPIAKKYGVRVDSADFTLIALAAGASVAHLPEERTKTIPEHYMSYAKQYFGNNPVKRKHARSYKQGTISSNFKRAASAAGAKSTRDLVRYLVRDEEIDTPSL